MVYLATLFAVALVGLSLSIIGQKWSDSVARERELDLLSHGTEIMNAISVYKRVRGQYPKSLKVLVKDKSGGNTRRYLRQIYKDPLVLSGTREWEIIKSEKGLGIAGVKSKGEGTPYKTSGFSEELKHFENSKSYSDWEFKIKGAKVAKVQSKSNK